jgi:putative membrane protein
MKRWQKWSIAAVAVLMISGCERNTARDNDAAVGTSGTAALAAADRDFVVGMIAGGTAEVELGRLAEEKASNPAGREFAEVLVRDHQKANAELKSIATKYNIDVSNANLDDHKNDMERMRKLSGPEFDSEYIQMMVDKHEKTVTKLEERANDDDNPEIRQWASRTLPTVRQHLEKAKAIKDSLKG